MRSCLSISARRMDKGMRNTNSRLLLRCQRRKCYRNNRNNLETNDGIVCLLWVCATIDSDGETDRDAPRWCGCVVSHLPDASRLPSQHSRPRLYSSYIKIEDFIYISNSAKNNT